jgi:RNA polymerase sigma-70 factor (ECF subfamily)
VYPSIARAAVLMEAGEPKAGLAALDELPHPGVTTYQPYWTVRGHLLRALGREDKAGAAFLTAAGLTQDSAVRSYLFSAAATKR